MNIYSIIAISLTMLAAQPVLGKCVTNHVKGTMFSNCNEETAATKHKMKDMQFKKLEDHMPESPKNNNKTVSVQAASEKGGVPQASPDGGIMLHHFKENARTTTVTPEVWKKKNP